MSADILDFTGKWVPATTLLTDPKNQPTQAGENDGSPKDPPSSPPPMPQCLGVLLETSSDIAKRMTDGLEVSSVIIIIQTDQGMVIRMRGEPNLRVDTALGQLRLAENWLMKQVEDPAPHPHQPRRA